MSYAWFDDSDGQAWDALTAPAEAALGVAAFAIGVGFLAWLAVQLGPVFLVCLAGTPLWVVPMLIFGP